MPKRPRPQVPEFPHSEYQHRYRRAWEVICEHGLGGLLSTSEPGYRYLTGRWTQSWCSKTRPMYAIIAQGEEPNALTAELDASVLRASLWLGDIHT